MGLLDIVVNGVALANQLTADLQASVSLTPWVVGDGAGRGSYGPVESVPAIVVRKQRLVKTASGEMIVSMASVTFLTPRVINEMDVIVLPDGTTGPILSTDGFVNRVTGSPVMTEVYLGDTSI